MSTDIPNSDEQRDNNEVELRELVYQSLERDGLITRLKAQLRAAVFKTIEKASNPSDIPSTSSYDGIHGRICRALVLDWLEQSNLLYTQDILKVETSGPSHSSPLTQSELLEQLHIDSKPNKSQPILHLLLDHTHQPSEKMTTLPEHIKQSINTKFPMEKIQDMNRLREHFRSLFSSAFDSIILDTFINKHIPSSSSSIAKFDYEQICLKWLQACAKVLNPSSTPIKQLSPSIPIQSSNSQNGRMITTQARRSFSPPSESNSSTSSHSENPRKNPFDFPLPTTNDTKKKSDLIPPSLIDFNHDDDDDTSSSLFSKRNATPAALNHLKTIEDIARDDQTPRTRTVIQKIAINGHKDLPIEYDDDSVSQSQISSIDDVTVDKASPSPSATMDFFEDL